MREEQTWAMYLWVLLLCLVILLIFSNFISLKVNKFVVYIRLVLLVATAVVGILAILSYFAGREEKTKPSKGHPTVESVGMDWLKPHHDIPRTVEIVHSDGLPWDMRRA